MTLETLRTFSDLGRAPKQDERVVVVYRLEDTTGMLVNPKYLATRMCGARGKVERWVPGHGGDLWWVTHDDGARLRCIWTPR
jgi:hypothetical protein